MVLLPSASIVGDSGTFGEAQELFGVFLVAEVQFLLDKLALF